MNKVIYIEGSSDVENGNLRVAFAKLLEKELKGNMPKIVMGNGKDQTIDKFYSTPLKINEFRFLLIDSDFFIIEKKSLCTQFNDKKEKRLIDCTENNTYFMVQESEAWILSQPGILNNYNIKTHHLPVKNVMEITKPSEKLAELYQLSGMTYHKVRDFCKIFPEIDTPKLKVYFPEFNELIKTLSD